MTRSTRTTAKWQEKAGVRAFALRAADFTTGR